MVSTGIGGLDKVLTGLRLGDNVVWQIDAVENYADFVVPFVKKALAEKRRLVYIRFARHQPLLKPQKNITVYELDAASGFETFSTQIHEIIKNEGVGVFYVFDCLSDLLSAWSNDLMIGNFFKITCPYLFELDTIAYFSLLRNNHSFKTVARIRDTTQLLIDVYDYDGHCYLHPLKVWNRYTPTMFLPHIRRKDRFIPIANSVDTAQLFTHIFKKGTDPAKRNLDYWDRLFMTAEELSAQKSATVEKEHMMDQLCRIIIGREEKMLRLARNYLSLDDLLYIKSRMIGTGFIGGKSVGMLIARGIVQRDRVLSKKRLFEPHDSFYVGSDVFYTYIVENGWWKARMEQRTKEGYFETARALKAKLVGGVFPEEIKEQFLQMIEYFGQSPIIVRSSSLLEDGYGNAFAGKYESIFLVNQGTPEQRYQRFIDAVRRIYASTMNEDALVYRLQRGLDQMDEQMALLVQRVSGAYHQKFFFPDVAGVGISYNTFVWKNTMDPQAGMLRLVLGLGTRAVNRVEGDYPRIVALDDPLLRAHAGRENTTRFSQHDVDLLDIQQNALCTVPLNALLKEITDLPLHLIAVRDDVATDMLRQLGKDEEAWTITFDALVSRQDFLRTMRNILKTLETAYGYPIDIEFTINFKKNDQFQINLLQCRPVQTKGIGRKVDMPEKVSEKKIVFRSTGNFLGGNISQRIDRIIYVDPQAYSALPSQSERYDIARVVGELNRQIEDKEKQPVMLLGPGRWGTTTPSLGVPVSFSEINNMTVLGEIAFAAGNAIPELSFGTHFFQDLVETGIFYIALFPEDTDVRMDRQFFAKLPQTLEQYVPQYAKYGQVIKIYDARERRARIAADIVSQKVVCFFE